MPKDKLFNEPRAAIGDFDFGRETAAVFDDMLQRSVPFYNETQRMIAELAADYAVEQSNLYDLGCSTCTAFLELDAAVPRNMRFVGVDFSAEMIARGREKLAEAGFTREYELIRADLNEEFTLTNASVVLMNLTLQFIRPAHRHRVIANIARGINPGGCLLMVEKVVSEDSKINRLFIKRYYDFKRRNGYSDLEIAQKREALENVLIPYRLEENCQLFLGSGFSRFDVFFKWYNFCGMIAVK